MTGPLDWAPSLALPSWDLHGTPSQPELGTLTACRLDGLGLAVLLM